jgi:UDP-glucose 4-epimerase
LTSSDKAINELGWKPRFNTLVNIIETAWNWHLTHSSGFSK